ncbi:MAG: lysophospholipid acyltransferase family protein [Bacillota bacterium]|nr:lysophospholipid acyltransferase family protein [Bacillota bacterium]
MIVYYLVRDLGHIYLRLFRGFGVENADVIPAAGPVIICPNHAHWFDPVIVAAACPRRPITFMAKSELFRSPMMNWLYRSLWAFPVRRGQIDRAALRTCFERLGQGHALGLFPEGARSRTGELRQPEPGAATIALRTGATVIPVGIRGNLGGQVKVAWGRPLDPADFGGASRGRGRQGVQALSNEIMRSIAELCGRPAPAPLVLAADRVSGRQEAQE